MTVNAAKTKESMLTAFLERVELIHCPTPFHIVYSLYLPALT